MTSVSNQTPNDNSLQILFKKGGLCDKAVNFFDLPLPVKHHQNAQNITNFVDENLSDFCHN